MAIFARNYAFFVNFVPTGTQVAFVPGLWPSIVSLLAAQCDLHMERLRSRVEAKVVSEDWRKQYSEVRLHSSLGKMIPKAYAGMIGNNLDQGATLKN